MHRLYLQCSDNSYYTGLTNDFEKRIWQHETGFFPECYTFKRRPVTLVWYRRIDTTNEAENLEQQIKGLVEEKERGIN